MWHFVSRSFLTRLCGGVFYWIKEDKTQCAKFELHNKLRLGHVDARIMRWFRGHPFVSEWMDTLGFYLVSLALSQMIPVFLRFVDCRDWLISNLPSATFGRATYPRKCLSILLRNIITINLIGMVDHV